MSDPEAHISRTEYCNADASVQTPAISPRPNLRRCASEATVESMLNGYPF